MSGRDYVLKLTDFGVSGTIQETSHPFPIDNQSFDLNFSHRAPHLVCSFQFLRLQISQKLSDGYNFSHDHGGTLPYCSPEVLSGEPFNQKTDIWSLGCILYEMVTGKRAFDVANNEEALK